MAKHFPLALVQNFEHISCPCSVMFLRLAQQNILWIKILKDVEFEEILQCDF